MDANQLMAALVNPLDGLDIVCDGQECVVEYPTVEDDGCVRVTVTDEDGRQRRFRLSAISC